MNETEKSHLLMMDARDFWNAATDDEKRGFRAIIEEEALGRPPTVVAQAVGAQGPYRKWWTMLSEEEKRGFRAIIKEEQRVASRALNLATMRSKAADMHSNEGGTRKNKKRSRRHKKRRGKKTRRHKSKRYKH